MFCYRHCGFVDTVYLDHAGATLYSELQMEAIFKDLTSNVYGNPRIRTLLLSSNYVLLCLFVVGKMVLMLLTIISFDFSFKQNLASYICFNDEWLEL